MHSSATVRPLNHIDNLLQILLILDITIFDFYREANKLLQKKLNIQTAADNQQDFENICDSTIGFSGSIRPLVQMKKRL